MRLFESLATFQHVTGEFNNGLAGELALDALHNQSLWDEGHSSGTCYIKNGESGGSGEIQQPRSPLVARQPLSLTHPAFELGTLSVKGMDLRPYLIQPGAKSARLDQFSTWPTKKLRRNLRDKADKIRRTDAAIISEMKDVMVNGGASGLQFIEQGLDCGGKDGVTRHVLAINPIGVRNVAFKAPNAEELREAAESPDGFLKRIARQAAKPGEFCNFNRSQLEDLIVPWVLGYIDDAERDRRCRAVNQFELELTQQGITVLKFYLHISPEEQFARLTERMEDARKNWKVAVSDWKVRSQWQRYREAYDYALAATSTSHAPWIIIPADAKWFRDICIGGITKKVMRAKLPQWQNEELAGGARAVAKFRTEIVGQESLLDEVPPKLRKKILGKRN